MWTISLHIIKFILTVQFLKVKPGLELIQVKEKTLLEALMQKRTIAGDETVVINYKMEDVSENF